ncbi:MAG: NAD(P)H-hydrate dehydratase [Schwartzia sp.]|nr:NAD(P)H-hydrate dehydratase [Schwartzia sp. (in: firmicutes)]
MRIALAEEMRRIDKMAAEVYGIDELLLMENAGRAAADALTGLLGEIADRTVCVLAGSGNNGGDAYAAARHLWSRGARIAIYSVGNAEHMKPATKKNLEICQKLGIPVRPITAERDWEKLRIYLRLADGVLDGILGTGVKGPLRGPEERLIQLVNEEAHHVVAIDVPSGIDADTGTMHGAAIMAETTATFGLPKAGLFFCPGAACAGRIVVDSISLPQALVDDKSILQEYLDDWAARSLLPARTSDAHKGSCGRVLVVAGSRGMTGAAVMASTAALKAGAGIVTLAAAEGVADVLAEKTTEVMTSPLPEVRRGILGEAATEALFALLPKYDTVLIGPGLGRAPETGALVRRFVSRVQTPLILDADALYAFCNHTEELSKLGNPLIMTPHLGEMAELLDIKIDQLRENLVAHARKAAADWNAILVMKSECTIVAFPDGRVFFTSKGNPSMATAGAGDVLAGAIAGLAKEAGPQAAALLGVYLHGFAGDLAADEKAEGLVAGDILEKLPVARLKLKNGE